MVGGLNTKEYFKLAWCLHSETFHLPFGQQKAPRQPYFSCILLHRNELGLILKWLTHPETPE